MRAAKDNIEAEGSPQQLRPLDVRRIREQQAAEKAIDMTDRGTEVGGVPEALARILARALGATRDALHDRARLRP